MEDSVLSQEEIDALLNDVSPQADTSSELGSDQVPNSSAVQVEKKEIRSEINYLIEGDENLKPLDFEHQERIIRGQFPVLERIYDRMIRNLTDELFLLFSRELEIKQEPFSIVKCREFMATLEPPLVIDIYRFDPLRSKGLIITNGPAIFEMVENYFGGHTEDTGQVYEERELTIAEIRTVQTVTKKIVEKLEASWQPIKPIKLEKVRSETSSQLLNIYAPADLLVTTKFRCSFSENSEGAFYIVMPYLMIDPIREQLELGASQSDQEDDPNWINALKNELLNVKLSVSAELANKVVKLSEVTEWKVDDFIPLEMQETVPMSIENYPLFHVKVGTSNEKCSLQVVGKINY